MITFYKTFVDRKPRLQKKKHIRFDYFTLFLFSVKGYLDYLPCLLAKVKKLIWKKKKKRKVKDL